ncbi:TAR DNA-binding protein 43-like [Mercenaria mercenaria]|uniref:TAR DNA-binding protein 43-like n=1 Tax=Mercenaria mercenaria TaxID=6596 RepID=UPI00234F4DAC|nr:TAR DNA-binding protein 43-like [Mercenaria mercenaria]
MASFVRVTDDENDEAIEIPAEDDGGDHDGTLLLSSLIAQFPGACGLKYRSETGGLRGVRLASGCLHPPNGFWGNTTYIVNFPKESKRKGDEEIENPVSTKMKKVETRRPSDLIVLGLPWKSTEDDMREYFKKFGDLILVQVKRDPRSGQSKGFGFIRFKDYESQLRCLAERHRIDGRWCEVNLPNSHNENSNVPTNRKIFVARCTEDITNEDLKEYFEEYGEVIDTFIPKPFRAFAFVTFADPQVAQRMCGEDHIIKGASVHISSAEPKGKDGNFQGERHMGGRGGKQRMREDSGGNWGQPSPRQPENMAVEPNMNNIGMNMLSSAMLAAAQAVFQGASNPNVSENYQLGPGFGGTRDSRSGGGYSSGNSWGSGDNPQSGQSSYSSWGNRSGGGGGYNSSSSSTQWGQGSRGTWN